MTAALAAVSSDYVMLDLHRIGGVSGWQQAAGIAAAHNREVSSHLFPEVSAHLLAATPTRHWFEYFDWAVPILQEPLRIVDRMALPSSKPGRRLILEPGCCGEIRDFVTWQLRRSRATRNINDGCHRRLPIYC